MQKKLNIDNETWEACRNGDKTAYALIYQAYYSHLFVYGCRFTQDNNLVEDCIQEIFTNFWINRQNFSAVKAFQAYLFVSFRNKLVRSIQQQHRSPEKALSEKEYDFELELSADQVMIDAEKMFEQKVILNDALSGLTERQKEVIFLKFYANLSYEEIAGILEISVKATYKLFSRAISDLRQTYQKKLASSLLSIFLVLVFAIDVPF
jgi:RNA polymerase sigma factor (sigma-70 family)